MTSLEWIFSRNNQLSAHPTKPTRATRVNPAQGTRTILGFIPQVHGNYKHVMHAPKRIRAERRPRGRNSGEPFVHLSTACGPCCVVHRKQTRQTNTANKHRVQQANEQAHESAGRTGRPGRGWGQIVRCPQEGVMRQPRAPFEKLFTGCRWTHFQAQTATLVGAGRNQTDESVTCRQRRSRRRWWLLDPRSSGPICPYTYPNWCGVFGHAPTSISVPTIAHV
jgi:hypothetical protein